MFLEVADGCGEGVLELLDALQGIVEGDDGAVAAVVHHIPEDVEGIEVAGVVARHEVPHHDGVTLLHEQMVCAEPHPAVRWTEQRLFK